MLVLRCRVFGTLICQIYGTSCIIVEIMGERNGNPSLVLGIDPGRARWTERRRKQKRLKALFKALKTGKLADEVYAELDEENKREGEGFKKERDSVKRCARTLLEHLAVGRIRAGNWGEDKRGWDLVVSLKKNHPLCCLLPGGEIGVEVKSSLLGVQQFLMKMDNRAPGEAYARSVAQRVIVIDAGRSTVLTNGEMVTETEEEAREKILQQFECQLDLMTLIF